MEQVQDLFAFAHFLVVGRKKSVTTPSAVMGTGRSGRRGKGGRIRSGVGRGHGRSSAQRGRTRDTATRTGSAIFHQ